MMRSVQQPLSRVMLWGILFFGILGCGLILPARKSAEKTEGQDPLRYEKTHCYGPCPVFQATWMEDGTATLQLIRPFLEGPMAVLEPGAYVGKWKTEAMEDITTQAKKLDYSNLDNIYDNPRVMDVPSVITSIGGHEVKNRFGGPDLKPLYRSFDRLLETTQWTPATASGSPTEH